MILTSLRRTLTGKFIVLLLCFLVLQGIQLVVGIIAILHLSEEAVLAGDVGKQRMRVFLLATYLYRERFASIRGKPGQEDFDSSIAEVDRFFQRYGPKVLLREVSAPSARAEFEMARQAWSDEMRPALMAIRQPGQPATAVGAAARRYVSLAPRQAQRFDNIVSAIEAGIRTDARFLAVFQSLLLAVSLMLGVAGLYMARRFVTLPMRRLIDAAEAIAAGAYQQRVPVSSRDEIGQLGATFNKMTNAIAVKTDRISALNQVAVVVASSLSKQDALDRIMRRGKRLVRADAVSIGLYDHNAERFDEWVAQGLSDGFVKELERNPGDPMVRCFNSNTYVVGNDYAATGCPLSQRERDEGIQGYICLPLISHSRRLGVINLYLTRRDIFLPDETELLITFGHLAAGAIENARLFASMTELAARDVLTGLYNRRMLGQRLVVETQRASRYNKPYSVLMLDIDHFKSINDTHGHPAGDAVLRGMADILQEVVRDIDTVARYGGEEFIIILPETAGPDATRLADRLRRQVAETPLILPAGEAIHITVSIGVASYPHCADTAQQIIECADEAMYAAKQGGKNRVIYYGGTS